MSTSPSLSTSAVCREGVHGAPSNRMLGPTAVKGGAVAFPPHDVRFGRGSGDHIEVAIVIQVRRVDGWGESEEKSASIVKLPAGGKVARR